MAAPLFVISTFIITGIHIRNSKRILYFYIGNTIIPLRYPLLKNSFVILKRTRQVHGSIFVVTNKITTYTKTPKTSLTNSFLSNVNCCAHGLRRYHKTAGGVRRVHEDGPVPPNYITSKYGKIIIWAIPCQQTSW